MEENKINEKEFTLLVELAINSGAPKEVLWIISTDLARKVNLDTFEWTLPDRYDEVQFEGFIKRVVDNYGSDFTGDQAFNIARTWIRNSNKTRNFKN